MNVYCQTCHRQHEVRRPHAAKVGPEQVAWGEVIGLTAFVLFVFAAIAYAGPVLLEGLLR